MWFYSGIDTRYALVKGEGIIFLCRPQPQTIVCDLTGHEHNFCISLSHGCERDVASFAARSADLNHNRCTTEFYISHSVCWYNTRNKVDTSMKQVRQTHASNNLYLNSCPLLHHLVAPCRPARYFVCPKCHSVRVCMAFFRIFASYQGPHRLATLTGRGASEGGRSRPLRG